MFRQTDVNQQSPLSKKKDKEAIVLITPKYKNCSTYFIFLLFVGYFLLACYREKRKVSKPLI